MEIPEPPERPVCLDCNRALLHLYSARTSRWVAFVDTEANTLTVHTCATGDRSTVDGPALDGTGNAPHSAAERSAGVSEGDRASESVRDLLGPPVGSMPGVQRMVTEAARSAQLSTLVEAFERGRRACLLNESRAHLVLAYGGWRADEFVAALENLIDDGDRGEVRRLLDVLDGYRPRRGSGRRREADRG